MRRVALACAVLACAAVAHTAHESVRMRRAGLTGGAELLYLPPAAYLRVMSLGYREALADLVWIQAVLYSGDDSGGQDRAFVERYLTAVTELAPRFRRPYAWGGVAMIYTGGAPDRDTIERVVRLYRRGVEQHPEDHELLFALGMVLARDVSSVPGFSAEERAAARREGGELIRRAAAFGAPPLVRQYAATLVDEFAADQLAIQFLETQLLQADDERLRRMLEHKLRQLSGRDHVSAIERLRQEARREQEAAYPYLSDTLYAVIRRDAP